MAKNSFKVAQSLAFAAQGTPPTSPVQGDVYSDGTDVHLYHSAAFRPLVTTTATQTLTGKTLTSPTINTPTIAGGTHTAITSLGVRDTSAAFDVILAATSTTPLTGSRTLTIDLDNSSRGLTLKKSFAVDGGNVTLTGQAAGSSVTLPSVGTLATLAGTETLTGKTLTGNIAVNLVSGAATVTLPTTTSTLATLALSETLTNKTLTDPVISRIYGGTAASSTLTLQSTSGAGTTDSILMKVGNNGAVTAATVSTTGAWTLGVASVANTLNGTWDASASTAGVKVQVNRSSPASGDVQNVFSSSVTLSATAGTNTTSVSFGTAMLLRLGNYAILSMRIRPVTSLLGTFSFTITNPFSGVGNFGATGEVSGSFTSTDGSADKHIIASATNGGTTIAMQGYHTGTLSTDDFWGSLVMRVQ